MNFTINKSSIFVKKNCELLIFLGFLDELTLVVTRNIKDINDELVFPERHQSILRFTASSGCEKRKISK